MNYLAHIYFSGKNRKVAVGNFIGDFVKGNSYDKYPLSFQEEYYYIERLTNLPTPTQYSVSL